MNYNELLLLALSNKIRTACEARNAGDEIKATCYLEDAMTIINNELEQGAK